MSVEAMAIAMNHSRATGATRMVGFGIASHDGDGGAWPSVARLARYAAITPRNVQKAVQRLVELGEVEVDVNAGGTVKTPDHSRPNLYHYVLRCPSNCDGTTQHRLLCDVCDEPLPTIRYAAGTHTRCARQAVDNHPLSPATPPVGSDGGPLSVATPELSSNHLNHEDVIPTDVSAREGSTVDRADGHEHVMAEHNGKPWRCIECGKHARELGMDGAA